MNNYEIYTSNQKDNLLLDYFKAWGIIIVLNAMVLISIYVRTINGWSLSTGMIRFLPFLALVDGYIIYIIFNDKHSYNLKSVILQSNHIELIVLKDVFNKNINRILYFQANDCIVQNFTNKKHLDFIFKDGDRYILNSEWFEEYEEIVQKIQALDIVIEQIDQ